MAPANPSPLAAAEALALRARDLDTAAMRALGADLARARAEEIRSGGRPPDRTEGPIRECLRRLVRQPAPPDRADVWAEARASVREADRLLWMVVGMMDRMVCAIARSAEILTRADRGDLISIGREAAFTALLRWRPEQGAIRQCVKGWIWARYGTSNDCSGDLRGRKDRGMAGRIYAARLDAPATPGSDATLADLVLADDPTEATEATMDTHSNAARALAALSLLTPRQLAAVRGSVMEGRTLEDVGRQDMGVTRERVRQHRAAGLAVLRAAMGVGGGR